jgi:hypothetical protein
MKERMMEREGGKPNIIGAHNALAELLSFTKKCNKR